MGSQKRPLLLIKALVITRGGGNRTFQKLEHVFPFLNWPRFEVGHVANPVPENPKKWGPKKGGFFDDFTTFFHSEIVSLAQLSMKIEYKLRVLAKVFDTFMKVGQQRIPNTAKDYKINHSVALQNHPIEKVARPKSIPLKK